MSKPSSLSRASAKSLGPVVRMLNLTVPSIGSSSPSVSVTGLAVSATSTHRLLASATDEWSPMPIFPPPFDTYMLVVPSASPMTLTTAVS